MKTRLYLLFVLIGGWLTTHAQDLSMYKAWNDSAYQTTTVAPRKVDTGRWKNN